MISRGQIHKIMFNVNLTSFLISVVGYQNVVGRPINEF